MHQIHNILKKILEDKTARTNQLTKTFGQTYFEDEISKKQYHHYSFYNNLKAKDLSLIAEIKKGSPSKGIIVQDFNPLEIAADYAKLNPAAFSVLTDEAFFYGHNNYLTDIKKMHKVPILRKDFIIDPIQIYETKAIGADALLLIVGVLDPDQLQEFTQIAKDIELDILYEIHSNDDIKKLINIENPSIIGINNRDLVTFKVDVEHALRQKIQCKEFFPDSIYVAESGYQQANQLKQIKENEFKAVLIGEGLVTSKELKDYFYTNES